MNVHGLNLPIQYLKGVGPKRANLLKRLGIETVKDALYYLPTQYEDRRNKKTIFDITPGEIVTAEGSIVQINEIKTRTNLSIIEAIISDGTGFLKAKWFNQTYLKKILREKTKIKLFGKAQLDYRGNYLEILNPEYELVEHNLNAQTQDIVPIYRLTEGLSQKQMQSIMQSALEFAFPYI
ncbi:MAG: hypothetical protein RMI01_09035, partial [Thermodesulfovibrio sp.]|nr:hypothetical protein [Thermodesulfovibrio sp.]